MKKERQIVIIGTSEFAEIAFEYFTHDSPYEVVAFSVEQEYLDKKELFGLPVVPFENLEKQYPPESYSVFVAITYIQLNRVRARLYAEAKSKGYSAVSFVSPHAFVWKNVKIGENCFIFENNVVQYNVEIGNNVILWSGNHIGHRSVIHDNCFISSHVVVSGYCNIGKNSFLGVNTALAHGIKIGEDTVTGVGAVVVKDLEGGKVYIGNPAKPMAKSSYEAFEVDKP